MENNKNKKSVKFQGDMLNFCDFIQVFVFTRNHHLKSVEEKAVTSLSPFIIEKQIESIIGSPKSVKKLKNKTLLVETNRKSQTENVLKTTTFFGLRVSVTEHQSLNSSKGIIRDRMLKGENCRLSKRTGRDRL